MNKLRPGERKPPTQGPKESSSSSPCCWSCLLESDSLWTLQGTFIHGPCASYLPKEGHFCSLTWTFPEPHEGPAEAFQPVAPNPHVGGEGREAGPFVRAEREVCASLPGLWGLCTESGNRRSARPVSLPTCLLSRPSCSKLDLPQLG